MKRAPVRPAPPLPAQEEPLLELDEALAIIDHELRHRVALQASWRRPTREDEQVAAYLD